MRWLKLLPVMLLAGCASAGRHLDAPSEQAWGCAQWYEALDRATDEAGVRDAQYARVAGFRHSRVDRFLASLRPRAAQNSRALQAFAERLGELDLDASRFAVYVQAAHTRYRERVLLQLVYTIWFAERPARGMADLLAGRLDGLVWRVTLAPDGEPLLYDSIHPCGCYHEFFPTPRARPLAPADSLEEWAFVPQRLPRVAEGERPVVVRLASGTHYIEQVSLVRGVDSLARYAVHPYDELRSLPRLDGGRRSAFGRDGLIVGRRHFDDPDLVERRFELDLAETP